MKSPLDAVIKRLKIIPAYRDKQIALIQGDCREILPKLRDIERVVIVSDPPYGIKWVHSSNPRPILGDDKPFDPSHLLRFRCILFGGQHYHTSLPQKGSWIIWDKRASENADAIPGAPFEVCWSRVRHAREFIRFPWGGWNNKAKRLR
jgi:hypothetical protein